MSKEFPNPGAESTPAPREFVKKSKEEQHQMSRDEKGEYRRARDAFAVRQAEIYETVPQDFFYDGYALINEREMNRRQAEGMKIEKYIKLNAPQKLAEEWVRAKKEFDDLDEDDRREIFLGPSPSSSPLEQQKWNKRVEIYDKMYEEARDRLRDLSAQTKSHESAKG